METIGRTLRLLRSLSEHSSGVGIKELSEHLGIPPSTVHRLLQVLMEHHFVSKEDDTRRYHLGPEVLELARVYLQSRDVVAVARPYLARLRVQTGETAFLTALVGSSAICVAIEESARPLRLFIEVGQRMPYHAAASARAILAFQPQEEIERLLAKEPLQPYTDLTPTTLADVRGKLATVRADGYAICESELDEMVTALATPVRDAAGRVQASVTVVVPTIRLPAADQRALVGLVREAGARMSATLGYRGDRTRHPAGAAPA